MSARHLTVGLVQHCCSQTADDNRALSARGVRAAAARGAQLVVLPELHTSLYFCQQENAANFDLAEPIPGPSSDYFGKLAAELGIVLVCSLFERRGAGLYHNTAVVFERDGRIAGIYRKMHIPDDPGYYEKYYFTPGDTGFAPINTSAGRLGVLVCWDQWYPEAARLMALAGAELLIYPTAIGWDPHDTADEQQRQLDAWLTIQRSHAVANALPVISANRHGHEPDASGSTLGQNFWGHSFIAGAQGEMLAQSQDEPGQAFEVLTFELDLQRTESVRRQWPYLRDRRIDAYADLARRYRDPR